MAVLDIALLVLVGLVGLAVGSFLNDVVVPAPQQEPARRVPGPCPACGRSIRSRYLPLVLSRLMRRERCRDCESGVFRRSLAVELVTAALFVVVAGTIGGAGLPWAVPAFLYLAAISVALAFIDVDTHTLPNRIVLPAYPISLVLLAAASAASADWGAIVGALVGGVVLFAFYFALAMIHPSGMGFGDVKLAGVLGLYLGWLGWGPLLVGAFSAFVLGGVFSLLLLAARRVGRRSGIPFGPWMLAGAGVGIVFGTALWDGYLGLAGLR
jgi:leader peptidase (prepilin peptidase)/N-methyltransferase